MYVVYVYIYVCVQLGCMQRSLPHIIERLSVLSGFWVVYLQQQANKQGDRLDPDLGRQIITSCMYSMRLSQAQFQSIVSVNSLSLSQASVRLTHNLWLVGINSRV